MNKADENHAFCGPLTEVSCRLTNVSQTSTKCDRWIMSASGLEHGPREPKAADTVDPEERKERILHTRVPESLDRHIKRRARSLGMSVSTVVRNVLLNTFGLVEDIVTDSTNIALAITGQTDLPPGERSRGRNPSTGDGVPAASEVLAWQEAVLNVNAVCGRCNTILPRGRRAAIGVRDQPSPQVIICRRCLGMLTGGRVAPAAKRRKSVSSREDRGRDRADR